MKKINYIIISALFAILPYTSRLKAQTIAVKSDLLTGALSSPNLSAEVKLSERFTLEAGFHYNPFSIGKDKYLKHWFVQPELRYWMYQPYKRSFLGINLMYNPQIQISAESETKRSIFREKDKTKRSKKESAQHSKSRNKSFVMTSVSAL